MASKEKVIMTHLGLFFEAEFIDGDIQPKLLSGFVQDKRIEFNDSTGQFIRVSDGGKRGAVAVDLPDLIKADISTILNQSAEIKELKAKDEARDTRITELEAENAALTKIVEDFANG